MRARAESVSWLEESLPAFPRGLRAVALDGVDCPGAPDRRAERSSYSGGAAPASHRTSVGPHPRF